MAFTVAQCISQAQYHMSDFPPASDAQALSIMNDVQSDILRAVRLYPLTAFNITLIANQQLYTLDPSVYRIWSCIWQNNASISSQIKVLETSIDELDYQAPNWRSQSASNVYRYFELGGQIGFVPAPAFATSAGYPIIILNTSTAQPFATTSSTLPAQVPTKDAWVWRACARWATMQRRDDAAGFADLGESALNDLIDFVNGLLPRQKPRVQQSYPRVRNI
jgi:hypothetical protein